MKTDQRLSVIIPTNNRPDALPYALSSVRTQNVEDIQVIVVNDGGVSLEEVVAPFREDLHVELVTYPANLGPSAARNIGLEAADGDFVSFLDDDDVLLPGHYDAMLPCLAVGEADFVYTSTKASTTRDVLSREGYHGAVRAFDYDFDHEFLRVANCIPTLGVVMRPPGAGGPRFDESVRAAEDWDMWLRLAAEGYRFRHIDVETGVYHRLPRHGGEADPPAAQARALRFFHDSYVRLCARWKVADESSAATGRSYVLRTYDLAFARLRQRKTLLAPFWYEQMIRALHRHHVGELAPAEVEAALLEAIGG
jgi:glycosyltransferase involved in cell wall biosynthesis